MNILTNARHAVLAVPRADTGTHGHSVATVGPHDVLMRTRIGGGRVTIAIRDCGVGIAPEEMTHIFDPYFTTRRAGTGLGLPIAKNIIEGLGGVLTVSSRRGRGDGRAHRPAAAALGRASMTTRTRVHPARGRRGEDPEAAGSRPSG